MANIYIDIRELVFYATWEENESALMGKERKKKKNYYQEVNFKDIIFTDFLLRADTQTLTHTVMLH